jgi:hypothetical protein
VRSVMGRAVPATCAEPCGTRPLRVHAGRESVRLGTGVRFRQVELIVVKARSEPNYHSRRPDAEPGSGSPGYRRRDASHRSP